MPYLYDHIFCSIPKIKKQISDWCLLTLDSLDHIHETPNIFLVFLQNPRSHLRSVKTPTVSSPGLTPGRRFTKFGLPNAGPIRSTSTGVHESARKLGYIYIYICCIHKMFIDTQMYLKNHVYLYNLCLYVYIYTNKSLTHI